MGKKWRYVKLERFGIHGIMKRYMTRCFIQLAFIGVLIGNPATTYAEAGWTEPANVIEVNPTARHYYRFRLPDIESPADCKQENGFYQDYKSRGADQMYAALLEAISSNLKVKVFVTGGCNLKGFAEVSSVALVR